MVAIGIVRGYILSRYKIPLLTCFIFSPLDLQPCQVLADFVPLCRLLWICLDSGSLAPCSDIQITQLDSSYRGLWSRSAPMGTNLVGNIRIRSFSSMGGKLCLWCFGLTESVVMARCYGCLARPWFWHDPLANSHAYAHMFHATCIAGHRLSGDHLCQSICSK